MSVILKLPRVLHEWLRKRLTPEIFLWHFQIHPGGPTDPTRTATTTMDVFVLFYKASNHSFFLFKPTTEPSRWKKKKKNLSRSRQLQILLQQSEGKGGWKHHQNFQDSSSGKGKNNWRCLQFLFLRKSAGCAGNSRMAAPAPLISILFHISCSRQDQVHPNWYFRGKGSTTSSKIRAPGYSQALGFGQHTFKHGPNLFLLTQLLLISRSLS